MSPTEAYLAGQTPTERKRLGARENEKQLEELAYRGKDGRNYCASPDIASYQRPPLRTVVAGPSFGFNLDGTEDGAATATTCAHQKFTGPQGEPGIDNQYYRALGCVSLFRSGRYGNSINA